MWTVITLFCDPGGIQTHDLQNRNLTLYSAKLRSQNAIFRNATAKITINNQETTALLPKKRDWQKNSANWRCFRPHLLAF